MAKITENNYEVRKDIGKNILKNFFEDECYNYVDAGEKEVCYNDLCIVDEIILLKELKEQFKEEVNKRILFLLTMLEIKITK